MIGIRQYFNNHYGLDLKSTDLDRPIQYSSGMLNAQYAQSGTLEKRKGYRVRGNDGGGHGAFVYNRIDPSTGTVSEKLLVASNTVSEIAETTFTITYSGSNDVAIAELYFDESDQNFHLQLIVGTTIELDQDLGKGFDEASILTLAQLKTAVDAITDMSATISGTTSLPAAFLGYFSHDLTASAVTASCYEFNDLNTPVATPLSGSETNKNTADFENVSFAQLNNVAYISNGYDNVLKYDGQNLYRAGLPTPTAPSTASAGAGSIAAGTYIHRYYYKQVDAVGNIIESEIAPGTSITLSGSEDVDVTVNNIQASTGFNTNCAIVAGAQSGVTTITVDDGAGGSHTMKAGDTAYFYDSVTGDYITRSVTSVAAGTITIDGANVNVADNAVISNNLRILIARTEISGSEDFIYEVVELPNDSFSATQVYTDATTDGNLGIQVTIPLRARTAPPKGKYLCTLDNKLVIAGNPDDQNTFYWSDTFSEYFPIGVNSEVAQSENGDPISGIIQSNEVLAVFESEATHVYSGDFTENNIRRDTVSQKIGCAAHHTLKQLESEIRFLSKKGVYKMVSGQIPVEVSGLIEPIFDQNNSTASTEQYKFKRSVAITDTDKEHYICFIPTETTTGSNVHVNDAYLIIVNDYSHNTQEGDRSDVWLQWRYGGTNPAGGMVFYNDDLCWVERRYSSFNTSVDHNLCIRLNDGNASDYNDNVAGIEWEYKTAWYFEGEPSRFKKYNRIKVYNIPSTSANNTTLGITTEKDFTEGFTKNSLTMDLSGAGDGYGLNPYGTAPYGDIDLPNVKSKLGGKFKAIRVIFSNSQYQKNIEITGWELEGQFPYLEKMKE